ncbi:MAG: diguanylate cyclase [Vulcanimicrobiaceae bacterium]
MGEFALEPKESALMGRLETRAKGSMPPDRARGVKAREFDGLESPAHASTRLSDWLESRSSGDTRFDLGYVLWALLLLAAAVSALMLAEAYQVSRVLQRGFQVQEQFREAEFLTARTLRYEIDMETGLRGYTSTGDPLFLEPAYDAKTQLRDLTPRLRSDLAQVEMPTTIGLLDDVQSTHELWLERIARPMIRDWRKGRDDALQRRGKALTDRIRNDMSRIEKLLSDRAPQVDRQTSSRLTQATQLISGVTFAGVGLIFVGAGIQYRGRVAAERLRDLALRDPLTGLFNRRFLQEVLEVQLAQAARTGRPLAVALFDIDNFKTFNDTFGHEAGDFVLREVAQTLRGRNRKGDVACRYGGEEFLVAFPGMSAAAGRQRVDALRNDIKGIAVTFRGKALPAITISAGVATFPECANSEALISAADRALYVAKRSGRDCVVLDSESVAT